MSNPMQHHTGMMNNQLNIQQQQQMYYQQQSTLQHHHLMQQQQQQAPQSYYNQPHQVQYATQQQQYGLQPQQAFVNQQQQVQKPQYPPHVKMYFTLLGLAERFRQLSNYRLSIHCLESILAIKPSLSPNFELDVHFNLCKYYFKYTTNSSNLILVHLEKAASLIRFLKPTEEYKCEATYLLYKFYSDLNQSYPLDLLREVLLTPNISPTWYLRLLFLIGDLLTQLKDYKPAAYFMRLGIEFTAQHGIKYTHILFILSKGLIHLLERNTGELQSTMQPCAALIENFQAGNAYQIESLKVFFLALQVTYFLQCGQMKSVKNTLKSLQHYVQTLSNRNEEELLTSNQLENFHWLEKDHLGILVYLLTVIHSMQSGSLEKAQKLSEKALSNIERIKNKQTSSFIVKSLTLLLLENVIRCRIAMGNRKDALKEINDSFQICKEEPRLLGTHSCQLHVLLGLYALSMNCFDAAESQFSQSLRSTNDTELWLYSALNLSLVYLYSNKYQSLFELADRLSPDKVQTQNTAYSSCSHFIRSIKLFCSRNYQEAQQSLREAILLANSEEIQSLSANGILFMGHMNFLLNFYQDSFNSLVSGLDSAEKLPDLNLRIYATLLLKSLYTCCKDTREVETSQKHTELSQLLLLDYYDASKMPQHNLIHWNDNLQPVASTMPLNNNNNQQ